MFIWEKYVLEQIQLKVLLRNKGICVVDIGKVMLNFRKKFIVPHKFIDSTSLPRTTTCFFFLVLF